MAQNLKTWIRTSKFFSQEKWRRTAIINVIFACVCNLILLIFLAVSISQPGASLARPTIVFDGSCTASSRLNLLLHFLINIISTAVLASSNFFMQILNAPSRQEIDLAHAWLQSLDIGIPSVRNLSHVSRLKTVSWFIFLATSIPIHLLFNSSVFETTYTGSQWYMTLATEAFTQGAPFFAPGASLSSAGSLSPTSTWFLDGQYKAKLYGDTITLDQYWNDSSFVRQKLESVAEDSHSWAFLSATQCYSEYVSCNPRNKYGDVVFVLNSTVSDIGWTRTDMFTFDRSTNLSTMWDTHVPRNAVNSLWFSTQCETTREKSPTGRDDNCRNSCFGTMGVDGYNFLFDENLGVVHEPWFITFFPGVRTHNESLFEVGVGFNNKFDSLRVNHCLAQPIQPMCKIGLSNALLLTVILSILVKVITGGVLAWRLPSASLVTPGDAIESFILYPDSTTKGLGTLDIVDAQQIEFGKREIWFDTLYPEFTTTLRPRKRMESLRRLGSIIPYTAWLKAYSILFAGVILLSVGFAVSSESTQSNYSGSLDHNDGVYSLNLWGSLDVTPGYIVALLLSNAPQLILSLCYFSYNSLLTQFHVEREWNAFGVTYKPLRVSYPTGEQTSSYRLQLPYIHSVPLILVSITLHWLVSNAVFLYVNEGGYWILEDNLTGFNDAFSVSDGSTITIGFSPLFLLILFITSVLFVICPSIVFGFSKTKSDMVAGGWNSLVISAACHVPDVERHQDEQFSTDDTDGLLRQSIATENTEISITLEDDEANFNKLRDLSQRKIRWGATALPRRLAGLISSEEQAILHLGFGGEEHEVSEPRECQYYI
ncbi:hypothetical protein F4678DRAFT_429407 [Xylaria arbuscula]|nr:hypothetical protein F4678DRAFT_429407 [Xylaria arbuscula]